MQPSSILGSMLTDQLVDGERAEATAAPCGVGQHANVVTRWHDVVRSSAFVSNDLFRRASRPR